MVNDKLACASRADKVNLFIASSGPHSLKSSTSYFVISLGWHSCECLHVDLKFASLGTLSTWIVRSRGILCIASHLFLALVLFHDIVLALGHFCAQLLLDLELHVPHVADVIGECLVGTKLTLAL